MSKISKALKRKYYRLIDRLFDGAEARPELADLDELFIIGIFIREAESNLAEFVGEHIAPRAGREERRASGAALLDSLKTKSITDSDYPVKPVRAALEKLLLQWSANLSVFSELWRALYHLRLGHHVPLLTPAKPPVRPPERAQLKCSIQAHILASLRFREALYGQGQINQARKEIADLVGREQTTIRDWEAGVRSVLMPGDVDHCLAMAKARAAEINLHKQYTTKELVGKNDEYYGDNAVKASAEELHKQKLLAPSEHGRRSPRKKGRKLVK